MLCCSPVLLLGSEENPQQSDKIVERFVSQLKKTEKEEKKETAPQKKASVDFYPELSKIALDNNETKAAMFGALTSYYEYRTRGFEHRKQVFAWQLLSAKIIFVIVVFLVLVGLYFSWVQFHKKMDAPVTGNAQSLGGNAPGPEPATTISASTKEIKVSSPVLGVIILVISLLFFYLYLIYVFPIEEIL